MSRTAAAMSTKGGRTQIRPVSGWPERTQIPDPSPGDFLSRLTMSSVRAGLLLVQRRSTAKHRYILRYTYTPRRSPRSRGGAAPPGPGFCAVARAPP